MVPKKHTKIFAKLSIYKMYYIKTKCQTDFHGLHTIGRPLEARWKPAVTQKNSTRSPEDRHFEEK